MTLMRNKIYTLLILVFCSLSAFANELAVMSQLAKDGAPNLAIKLLDESQPSAKKNLPGWLFFEEQRLQIMNNWEQWPALVERLSAVPEQAPDAFKQFSALQLANAYLQNNQPKAALSTLQKLIWQPYVEYKEQDLLLYRRLVVRAYLLQGKLPDARKSIIRYEQDYGATSDQWKILKARVLLLDNRADKAEALLKGVQGREATTLLFLAALKADTRRYAGIVTDVRAQLKNTQLSAVEKLRYWLVLAEAAKHFETGLTRVKALEQAALLNVALPAEENILHFDADMLWQAYRDYGYADGNREQLLVGDDESWRVHAKKALATRPAKARALYSVIIAKSYDEASRTMAFREFADSFTDEERGDAILAVLFTQSKAYRNLEDMPVSMRYRLINLAINDGDIKRAAWLMGDLQTAPEGVSDYEWNLRRARILILSGQAQQGAEVLQGALQRNKQLDATAVDRAAQVIFDLQSVHADRLALPLLQALLKLPLEAKQQRELLFWAADSYKAEQQTARAAASYLRSATLLDGFGYDPWGQTARYKAAEVLAEGGIYADAERLFRKLLETTADAKRKAVIRNQLQSLKLKQNTK